MDSDELLSGLADLMRYMSKTVDKEETPDLDEVDDICSHFHDLVTHIKQGGEPPTNWKELKL